MEDGAIRIETGVGYGRDDDKDRARAAGFAGHLVKPIDFAVLGDVLAEEG